MEVKVKSPFIKRQQKGSKSKSTKFKSCVALARLTIDSNASPCPNHQNWDIQNLDWGKQYKITKSCGLSIMSLPINYIKSRWCFFSNQKNIYIVSHLLLSLFDLECVPISQSQSSIVLFILTVLFVRDILALLSIQDWVRPKQLVIFCKAIKLIYLPKYFWHPPLPPHLKLKFLLRSTPAHFPLCLLLRFWSQLHVFPAMFVLQTFQWYLYLYKETFVVLLSKWAEHQPFVIFLGQLSQIFSIRHSGKHGQNLSPKPVICPTELIAVGIYQRHEVEIVLVENRRETRKWNIIFKKFFLYNVTKQPVSILHHALNNAGNCGRRDPFPRVNTTVWNK